MFNFSDIAALSLAYGAGRQIGADDELADAVTAYLSDATVYHKAAQAGLRLVTENRGALAKTLALIRNVLPA